MIIKESISTKEEGNVPAKGTQMMNLRTEKWYCETFINYGFELVHSKLHDRRDDGPYGYDDEMLFCLEPIPLSSP